MGDQDRSELAKGRYVNPAEGRSRTTDALKQPDGAKGQPNTEIPDLLLVPLPLELPLKPSESQLQVASHLGCGGGAKRPTRSGRESEAATLTGPGGGGDGQRLLQGPPRAKGSDSYEVSVHRGSQTRVLMRLVTFHS